MRIKVVAPYQTFGHIRGLLENNSTIHSLDERRYTIYCDRPNEDPEETLARVHTLGGRYTEEPEVGQEKTATQ